MLANWSWPGAVASGIVVFAACLFIYNTLALSRRKLPAQTPNTTKHDSSWLEELADQDDQQMPNSIHAQSLSATNEPHLDAPNPYVDLRLLFINASVFTLTPIRADGRFKYRGYDLRDLPELFKKAPIGHARYGEIVIRQWLTPEVAKQISTDKPVSLETGHVAVWFSYSNRHGDSKEARSGLGNSVLNIV
jgi:hypothetical protein